ncbi:MAG: hypothetical protein GXP08_03265 [Gammaproteobacteria bacterium]|nr:hypothetical protein [Gammaproteobacteria bacterium]
MNTLAAFRDAFIILGGIAGLAIFGLLLGTASTSGQNATELMCEYLQENEPDVYNQVMGSDHSITAACCAYDPNNSACKTIQ